MTGDKWRLTARAGAHPPDSQHRTHAAWRAQEVALFSGGLDSGAYAAQRFHEGAHELLLIGHDPDQASAAQRALHHAVTGGSNHTRLMRVGDIPKQLQQRAEPSTRSRGLLYAATAIYAASAHGLPTATMPENGHVAINPPLTPARIGSNSTRSAHPWIIEQINSVIADAGGATRIINPYLPLTKGEVCRQALDAGLPPHALARTTSCGRPSVARKHRNCGLCFPCLI